MNVLRFTGKNNKSALDQVRQHLGPDALILSNRRTPRGIEICATGSLPDLSNSLEVPVTSINRAAVMGSRTMVPPTNEAQMAPFKHELTNLQEIKGTLGERKKQDARAQRRIAATIAQRLITLGLESDLAGELSETVPVDTGLDTAWQYTLQVLTSRLIALSDAEVAGLRVKVLVGSSGSGKTCCAVAMLSDALRRYAPEEVAIIHCGDRREPSALLGAATSLNIEAHTVTDQCTLADAMAQCHWAREIIIDSPGLNTGRSSQDPVLAMLTAQRTGVAVLLVLPATGQVDYLRQIVTHVSSLPLAGVIITKVDEAVSLGGVIDVVARENLPLVGRMVLEQGVVVPISGHELLNNAKRLTKRTIERRASQFKVAI